MRIYVSSSCGSTRRSVARSNRFRSTRPMPSRDFSRPVAIALASAACVVLQSVALAGEAREEVTRSFEQAITVTGAPALLVEHRMGDLRVRAHARNELRIQATIHVSADSRSDASVIA